MPGALPSVPGELSSPSGLSVLDFMKRTTLLGLDAGSMAAIGPDALTLAESEGLEAHARSIVARLNQRKD